MGYVQLRKSPPLRGSKSRGQLPPTALPVLQLGGSKNNKTRRKRRKRHRGETQRMEKKQQKHEGDDGSKMRDDGFR